MRAPDPSVADQRADDPLGGGIHRDRETETGARERSVDPDDAPRGVGQRSAGVARIQRGVGLDHVVDHPDLRSGPRRQRPAEGADDARRHTAGEPEGIADGHDELSDHERRRVAEPRRLEVAVFGDQDREVGEGIAAANAEAKLPPVGEVEPATVASGHDVGGGDQVSVGAQGDRRATPERGATRPTRSDHDRRDRRRERRGHPGQRARVCVEQLGVVVRVTRHPDPRHAPSARP